ncbi:uncharacterized protein LACBIDRAFT_335091 [Laccaria bicolor S238N-H82]|uniref:Predicted protein n=1 Tax=Laccaria bicolor (strain S238N-H82 / ATCC MYA-4686) TaxID=486041 RepID=B0E1B9_LACBS|nr:uncharacterized protein LACBIDRAFT_335091 [Laccaria bicolor S238N-H82]EDQ99339.1 predicted protein [Laccaria bicolor S238N-H82]|eukprot:XP_001889985.1 predicted protein [Laccaria bicolor S238N-H82]
MPRRNGNGATSQYVLPVCFESLGSFLDFHLTRPNTYALFPWVGERVLAPGTSTGSTATTFAGMNYVDAHLHDNLGLLSSRLWRPEEEHTWLRSSTLLPSNVTRSSPLANTIIGLYGFNVASSSLFISTDSINQLLLLKRSQSVFTHACRVKRVPSVKPLPFTKTTMSAARGSSTGSPSIEITEIRVSSQHILKSVQLSIGSFERESSCLLNAKTHNFELSSPCQLSPSESLYLQVRFRGLFRAASKSKIPLDELLSKVGPHFSGKQGLSTLEWSKSFDKFDVVLKFSQYAGVCALLPQTQKRPPEPPTSGHLQPTTDELFKLVERFRVLVIGKVALLYLYSQILAYSLFLQSGVGKSSLINECFGVKDAVRSFPRLLKIRS